MEYFHEVECTGACALSGPDLFEETELFLRHYRNEQLSKRKNNLTSSF